MKTPAAFLLAFFVLTASSNAQTLEVGGGGGLAHRGKVGLPVGVEALPSAGGRAALLSYNRWETSVAATWVDFPERPGNSFCYVGPREGLREVHIVEPPGNRVLVTGKVVNHAWRGMRGRPFAGVSIVLGERLRRRASVDVHCPVCEEPAVIETFLCVGYRFGR